jgi:protein gp37
MSITKIEWAQKVWNPVTGCTPVSQGCEHCYATRFARRLAGRCGYPAEKPFAITFHPERLDEPLHWRKPCRVFVCSMGDLFHDDVPLAFISKVFDTMACAILNGEPHTFIILTKRPERMQFVVSKALPDFPTHFDAIARNLVRWPLSNVWLGVSVEDQATADERIPILLQTPAAVRIVSIEPMLGPVDLCYIRTGPDRPMEGHPKTIWHPCGNALCKPSPPEPGQTIIVPAAWTGLDWVICGGETGPGARPIHPDWVRKVRDQCAAAGVPFFFKSWGEWSAGNPASEHRGVVAPDGQWWKGTPFGYGREHPGSVELWRCGKAKAGRMLDGRMHEEFPKEAKEAR